jgi:hypothetical protein
LSNVVDLKGLFEELEGAVEALREPLRAAARQLRERVTTSGIDQKTLDLMKQLEQQLEPLVKLQKVMDDLDPHTLSPEKLHKAPCGRASRRLISAHLNSPLSGVSV